MHIISFILNDAARVFSSISDTFWFWIYLKWLLWRWWGSIIEYILQDKYRDNDGAGGDIRVQVKLNVLQKISMEITMALVVIYECGWNWWVTEFLLPPCPRRSCGQTNLLFNKYIHKNKKYANQQIHKYIHLAPGALLVRPTYCAKYLVLVLDLATRTFWLKKSAFKLCHH